MAPAVTKDEATLAHAAAAGDGEAFATLYERYEERAFNLALRVTGSREDAADATQDAFLNVMRRLPSMGDRELNFGSYLFTAARNACYDLMAKRKRSDPTDEIPETAAHMSGGGGFGFDPGDPGDDPERGLLLDAQQEEIREANGRLPERQREALALFELDEMTYDEVAEIMDMNRNSVAQLISRARINLRDELRGTAMATIATSTVECERALPLIAMREDGQLDEGSEDGEWLTGHIAGCDTCRLSREAMQEAGTSYRAWAPVAASPFLMHEVMAKAAELTGSDWTKTIAERTSARAAAGGAGGATGGGGGVAQAFRGRAVGAVLAVMIAAVMVVVVFESSLDDPGTVTPVDPAAAEVKVAPKKIAKKKRKRAKKAAAAKAAQSTEADQPVAGGETPSGSGATGTSSPSGSSGPVTKTPVKKRVTKAPTPQVDPDPPVVEEPPVVVEPPGRTDDPQPCVPVRGKPSC